MPTIIHNNNPIEIFFESIASQDVVTAFLSEWLASSTWGCWNGIILAV
jgi:hypothetical protein